MVRTFGDTDLRNGEGAFAARIRLADGPLELAWRHCSATADFLADFFALHFAALPQPQAETRHSISYLVNELLENAVKFRAAGDILIESSLLQNRFETRVTNRVDFGTAARFQELLKEMMARDPGELLIERIEANALNVGSSGSGLGLLTLMNDYGARLGWIFCDLPAKTEAAQQGLMSLQSCASFDLS